VCYCYWHSDPCSKSPVWTDDYCLSMQALSCHGHSVSSALPRSLPVSEDGGARRDGDAVSHPAGDATPPDRTGYSNGRAANEATRRCPICGTADCQHQCRRISGGNFFSVGCQLIPRLNQCASLIQHIMCNFFLLWPPKERPLYFTAVIHFYFFTFYYVSIDERPAMGSQPNLASRSQVVLIYKCLRKISGALPQMWDAKNIKFLTTFFASSALDAAYISGTKRRIDKQKCYCQSTMRPLEVDLLSVACGPKNLRSVCLL